MILFESFCGGLVAPESDNNLNYKFTCATWFLWVKAVAVQEGTYKYIPYCTISDRVLDVEGYGSI
jgi:hypothetical protein